jgi:predicted ATPase/DNA-binding winged helix-turn-helix (wHTH) protein
MEGNVLQDPRKILPEAPQEMKQFGEFGLDTLNECLVRGCKSIALPPKPFAVLRYLVEHPGRLITHDELLDALWPETYVQPQVLRTYMLDLRKALGDDPGQPRFIQTVPKRGYRFVAQLTQSPDSPEPELPLTERQVAEARPAAAPTALQHGDPSARIVNRQRELASLQAHLECAAGGQRQVVFVTGEAGIGKTALVDTFCKAFCDAASPDRAVSVARGQCVEGFGSKEEYYPVTEALRQLCASPDGDRACRILARMAPAWLAAMGRELRDDTAPPFAPERTPIERMLGDRMPGDLCAAIEELVAEKPLILVIEDLQWADGSTLHLLSALARRRFPAKLLLIATCRPQEAAIEDPARNLLRGLKQDLRLHRLCAEIALAPLAKTAVRELLARELQQKDLPPGLASFIHRRSEGNPLFAIAILEHLMTEKYLLRDETSTEARWVQTTADEDMEASVPEGLAQMIELELARLTEQEQRILEAGSLMSVAFPSWAVAAALEMDSAEAEEACEDLARRLYFVQRAGADELPDGTRSTFYVFAHGLYREVLWSKQSETRRARRHVRIAERLAQLFHGREATVAREMALHYEAASSWQRALEALRIAAGHALERHAHAEASELLERALHLAANLHRCEADTIASELRAELKAVHQSLAQAQEDNQTVSQKA